MICTKGDRSQSSMDFNLQDAADLAEAGRHEGAEEEHEQHLEQGSDEENDEEDDEENAPKKRRGKDREWKLTANFANQDIYKDSDIYTEIKSEMYRNRNWNTEDSRVELYLCNYSRKAGYKSCPRLFRVEYSHTSLDIFVYGTEDEHQHEEDPEYQTNLNYRWTEAQEEVIHQHLRTGGKSNKIIWRQLRDDNLTNASGRLPTLEQVAFEK